MAWLDGLGRVFTVYGTLAIILLALGAFWWPGWLTNARRRYLGALLISAGACALMMVLEQIITTQLLHHEFRARPANARWVTLLITEDSHLSFPAWPVTLAFALAVPAVRFRRACGWLMCVMGVLLTLAMVFVGINYPLDVLTGVLLGVVIGLTALALVRTPFGQPAHAWRTVLGLWLLFAVWGGLLAVTIQPVHVESGDTASAGPASSVMVVPPAALLSAVRALEPRATVAIQAATNGHLTAAVVQVTLPEPTSDLPAVEGLARRAVNVTFAHWKPVRLLTIEITAAHHRGTRLQLGTLYTATIAREQWPAAGFSAAQALPGKKYFQPQFYHVAGQRR